MSDIDVLHLSKRVIKTKELIELVRERRCLWDRSYPHYRDRTKKDKAWLEIYRHIEPSFDSLTHEKRNQIGSYITRKWYNIRDSYVKSRKNLRPRNRPYLYAEAMSFLDSTTFGDKKSIKKSPESYVEDSLTPNPLSNDEEENAEKEWIEEVFNDDDNNGDTCDIPKRPKLEYNQVGQNNADLNESIVQVLATLIQKEEDEDRAFFKSIIPSVKKLSENSKFQFRIQVMRLLSTLKMREREEHVTLKIERESNLESDSE